MQPSLGRISARPARSSSSRGRWRCWSILAEHAGEVVSRQQIIDAVWRQEFVSDATVSGTIAKLRKALGDDARNPRYIETLAKRGYRLLVRPMDRARGRHPARRGLPGRRLAGGAEPQPDVEGRHRRFELERSTMDVLLCLAERGGEPVPKQELVDRVWRTESVSDLTVGRRIAELQEALGDNARQSRLHRDRARARLPAGGRGRSPNPAPRSRPFRLRGPSTERDPYPGLAVFTEADAELFFGREAETAAMWRRITSRRLLAVIGPSGVGKSSFLRAGVIPAAPPGWRSAGLCPRRGALHRRWPGRWCPSSRVTPSRSSSCSAFDDPRGGAGGAVPLAGALGRGPARGRPVRGALHPQPARDPDPFRRPAPAPGHRGPRPRGARHARRLPQRVPRPPAARRRSSGADRCSARRPPTTCGAPWSSPPCAAAFASRTRCCPTRWWRASPRSGAPCRCSPLPPAGCGSCAIASDGCSPGSPTSEIGGVGGALAQHAEATLDAIGRERLPLVRELFRNLVTAQATRATRSVDDLLSVFDEGERDAAGQVLQTLIDARLLTSFEEEATEEARRRVRAGSRSCTSRCSASGRGWCAGRPRTPTRPGCATSSARRRSCGTPAAGPPSCCGPGTPYLEFRVWRESYPGGLTATEQAFADAMVSHAGRRRRRRRLVAAAVLLAAAAVAAVTTALWRRSEAAMRGDSRRGGSSRSPARRWTRRPPRAFAYAMASLEVVDSPDVPPARPRGAVELADAAGRSRAQPPQLATGVDFSPDGHWLVTSHFDGHVGLWRESGELTVFWRAHEDRTRASFTPDSGALISGSGIDPERSVWSVPEARRLGTLPGSERTSRTDIDARLINLWQRLWRRIAGPGRAGRVGQRRPRGGAVRAARRRPAPAGRAQPRRVARGLRHR